MGSPGGQSRASYQGVFFVWESCFLLLLLHLVFKLLSLFSSVSWTAAPPASRTCTIHLALRRDAVFTPAAACQPLLVVPVPSPSLSLPLPPCCSWMQSYRVKKKRKKEKTKMKVLPSVWRICQRSTSLKKCWDKTTVELFHHCVGVASQLNG